MEMLNNIWTVLSTENEILIKILSIFLLLIEMPLIMQFFRTLLNISATKKQKIIYLSITIPIGLLCIFVIPKPYSNILTLISAPFIIMYVFRISFLKSLFAEFIPNVFISILELICARLFLIIFNIDYNVCAQIPLFRLIITLSIYIILFVIYKLIKHFNFNITILDNLNKKNKIILLANTLIAIVVIFIQMYLIVFYYHALPTFVISINILSLISYFFISTFSMVKTMKLEKTTEDLEQEKLYNKTLQILHDNIRAFKHDFSNIIAGIGGYIETNDMNGLTKYYKQLLTDCNQVNNLSSLSPDAINNPAVYTVLANKYYRADELNIKITLESFIDFNNLYMEIYKFTRILGILMDNAIEAASECDEKIINVTIRNDIRQNRQLLIIENTYKNKDINLYKIYEKGFSTKPKNTGLGLWEVNKIISQSKNISRFTSKTNKFFKQQIEIYNE